MSSSSVWSKGDEPVRVGSKVLCNYVGRDHFEGILEPIGIVIGHDGSSTGNRPWIVLTRYLTTEKWDFNFFCECDLKVLGGYDSLGECLSAVGGIVEKPPTYLNMMLRDMQSQIGKVHEELENE